MPKVSNYILTEKICENEKTVVYRGKREVDELQVIIKQINDEHPDFTHVFRMRHEYEINQRINSNHVAKIYEMNEKDNSPFLATEDDGKGIDVEKIKEKAMERGLIRGDKVSSLTNDHLVDLIFSDSFSTKDLINEISGRGYGLSAVKSEIMKLKGTIQVDTSVGRGTKFIFTFLNND